MEPGIVVKPSHVQKRTFVDTRPRSVRWWRETYADGSACIRGIGTPWGGIVDVTDCACANCRDYCRRYAGTRYDPVPPPVRRRVWSR
jgi:hypothetical protein